MPAVSFESHVPAPALRPFVNVARGYRVPPNATGVHRGLPSRHLTLVIELNAPLRVSGPRNAVAAHAVVGGLHAGPAWIDASLPQEGLHYGLSPLGARALVGVPAADLAGLVVDLQDIIGSAAGELVERVGSTDPWHERFRLVDAALLRRLDERPTIADEVAEAWRMILATNGRMPVADVAAHVGWSRRHLSERFGLATGVTPKQAARIARFEEAHRLLLHPQRPSLAHIAVAAGYADQPHLAREWKALAGCSVGTWLREELPFVQDTSARTGRSSAA